MTYGDRALRIYSAVPYNVTAQRPVLYMLDGNGLYPKAVNRAVESCQRINYRLLLELVTQSMKPSKSMANLRLYPTCCR